MEPALSYAEILEQQLEVNRHRERVSDLTEENQKLKQQLAEATKKASKQGESDRRAG